MQTLEKAPAAAKSSKNILSSLQLDARLLFMLIAIALVWLAFNVFTEGTFLSIRNLWNLSVQTASVGVMVSGMVLVLVMRQVDLSVGSILGFTGMLMAVLSTRAFPMGEGWNGWITLLIGLLVGGAIGAFQGWWVAFLNVPAFIVTLGGLLIYRGGAWLLTEGQTIGPLADSFQFFGGGLNGTLGATWTWVVGGVGMALVAFLDFRNFAQRQARGLPNRPLLIQLLVTGLSLLLILGFILVMNGYPDPLTKQPRGMPVPVLIMLGVILVMMWVVRSTKFGRYVFAYGGNPEAARLAGINTKRLMVSVFALLGMLAALAGAIQTARLNSGANSTGTQAELSVIAAAVIGGTSLAGGVGSIPGAFLGALLMSSILSGMGLINLTSAWQNVVQGIVLMLAVLLDVFYNRNRTK